jgi:hypothetical protein
MTLPPPPPLLLLLLTLKGCDKLHKRNQLRLVLHF